MNWFKKTTYPKYWKDYIESFQGETSQQLDTTRFVVFDTETTGLNPKTDRILSIGAIGISHLKINVSDQLERYLNQQLFNTESVKIHGLLKNGFQQKCTEEEAIQRFLSFCKDAVLVAHHAAFDVAMINASLKRLGLPKLKNKILDTGHLYKKLNRISHTSHFSLDELSKEFNIEIHDRHTASGDALITALLFLKLIAKLTKHNPLTIKDLQSANTFRSLF